MKKAMVCSIFTCVEPDPYSEYWSKSTKLLNTDLIWIRIHKTDDKWSEVPKSIIIKKYQEHGTTEPASQNHAINTRPMTFLEEISCGVLFI